MAIKKGWKITWIALGSLLGLTIVTLAVVLWLILTPSKLTRIVNNLADNFITCPTSFGNVDFTLLSTFPDAGLKIENVLLLNPMEGSPNDTVAQIGTLTVGIDLIAFLKENKVIVHKVLLDDASANLYIDHDGKANFDILPPSEKDTSTSSLPELIDLKKIKIKNLNAKFDDDRDGMSATVRHLDMSLKGRMKEKDIDGDLDLEVRKMFVQKSDSANSRMLAMVKDLELNANGTMKGDDIDAVLRLGSKDLTYNQTDSIGTPTLQTKLQNIVLKLDGKGDMDLAESDLKLEVEHGTIEMGNNKFVNDNLQASKKKLLKVELLHLKVKPNRKEICFDNSTIQIDDYALALAGQVCLANETSPLTVDIKANTDGAWQLEPLLAIVPETYMGWKKGMDVDGKLSLDATVCGTVTDSTMPRIDAAMKLEKGRYSQPAVLPCKVEKINADLTASIDLNRGHKSSATIKKFTARTRDTKISLSASADDLLGDMRVDAKVKGTLPLTDIKPFIPKGMQLEAKGDADLDLHAAFRMSDLTKKALEKINANGTLKVKNLDLNYDTIHAVTPSLNLALSIPAKEHSNKLADAHITAGDLQLTIKDNIKAKVEHPDISVGVNNIMQSQLAAAFDIRVGETEATVDSAILSLGELKLVGSVRLDSTQKNPLLQYNPVLEAFTHSAVLYTPQMPDAVRLSELDLDYKPNHCNLKSCQVKLGHSDFELYGTIDNIEQWLSHKTLLRGDLNFTSSYADVDQLMTLFSGSGTDPDSLEAMRREDATPADANPFIVPRDVDITLHTHIKRSIAFGNDLNDVAGSLTIKDGVAILDQMGFVCKAATMQLTAFYRSPRPSNLFTAIDFHLLDIQIDELISMIPCIDTLVPLLSAFDGNADFHLAGETYLNERYQPKLSSIMGAAAISGKDLVVMDNSNLATIAKLMRFKKWKEKDNKIRIDSLSVEMTCMDAGFGTEVEVLPFLLNVGSYQICASGVQNIDKTCAYHLELLKNPLLAKIAVDVKGNIFSPKITLGKLRYADLYKPKRHGAAEKKALEIKSRVRKALEKNVR